jgi:hypothetical protein
MKAAWLDWQALAKPLSRTVALSSVMAVAPRSRQQNARYIRVAWASPSAGDRHPAGAFLGAERFASFSIANRLDLMKDLHPVQLTIRHLGRSIVHHRDR